MPSPALSNKLSAAIDQAAGAHQGDRSAEHLGQFAFRFAPPAAPAEADSREAGPWSLARTLGALRRRGATVVETDRGVRLVRPGRAPAALTRALEAHGPSLRLAVRLGVLDHSVPAPWSAGAWDDATRLHAAWFGLEFSPAGAFDLAPGVRVADLGQLRASVARQLAAGPDAPAAARLASDLASLYARFGPATARVHVLPPARSMAA